MGYNSHLFTFWLKVPFTMLKPL